MTAFASLDGLARIWGNWMLHMAWQATLLIVILSLLTWVWRQKSAVFLHALWLLVLMRLVVPPAFAFPTGWAFWILPAADSSNAFNYTRQQPGAREEASNNSGPGSVNRPENRGTVAGLDHAGNPTSPPPAIAAAAVPAPADGQPAAEPPASTGPADAAVWPVRSWAPYLLLAWAGVAGTLLGLLFWGSVRVKRWVREAEPIDDSDLYLLLEDCRAQLRIAQLIELRNSESCTTPVVVGFHRPVILLPKAVLTQLNMAEMKAVLLHELNHIARGDALVNLVQGVLGALYFFHPLVWWANASLRRLREEACDELTVLALGGERRTYGEALVKVTEIFGYASPPLALGVLESKSPARARLGRILDPQLPQDLPASWRNWGAVLLLALVLLPGAGGRSSAGQKVPDVAESGDDQIHRAESSATQPEAETPAASDRSRSPTDQPGPETQASSTTETRTADSNPNAGAAAIADARPRLRYRWDAGKSYAYSVQIEADLGDTIELFSGTPLYTVRSIGRDGTTLLFTGRLMPQQRLKAGHPIRFGRPPRLRSPFSPFSGVGFPTLPAGEHVLQINDRGELQSVRGQSQLPFVLGNLSELVITPLPDDGADHWQESEKTSITIRPGDNDPFPRPRFGPFADRDEGERLEARQNADYSLVDPQADTIVIRKKYELKTSRTQDGQPRLELTGQTETVFDLLRGLPRSISGEFKLTQNGENITQRIPITVSAKLLSDEERARLETRDKAAVRWRPLDDKTLDQALADLHSGEPARVQNAASKLEHAEPRGRQAEVARALEALLEDKESFTRQATARALVVWCTTESVAVLIKALDDDFITVPQAALEALGKLQDEQAIPHIIRLLKAGRHREQAVQALAAIGKPAERPVLELLADSNADLRRDACQVLKAAGSDESVAPLARLASDDSNESVRMTADEALKAVRSRID